MVLPLILMAVLLRKDHLVLEQYSKLNLLANGGFVVAGIALVVLVLVAAYHSESDFYADYQEFMRRTNW
jgi:hypothetical protein